MQGRRGPAVDAPQAPGLFEVADVAPVRLVGDAEPVRECADGNDLTAVDHHQDLALTPGAEEWRVARS